MLKKSNAGELLIIIATVLYTISLFLPWTNVAFQGGLTGVEHRGYVLLALFAYPVYIVVTKRKAQFFGLASAVAAFIYLVFYSLKVSRYFMGESISKAGSGLYLAIFAAIMLIVGYYLLKKQNLHDSRESVK